MSEKQDLHDDILEGVKHYLFRDQWINLPSSLSTGSIPFDAERNNRVIAWAIAWPDLARVATTLLHDSRNRIRHVPGESALGGVRCERLDDQSHNWVPVSSFTDDADVAPLSSFEAAIVCRAYLRPQDRPCPITFSRGDGCNFVKDGKLTKTEPVIEDEVVTSTDFPCNRERNERVSRWIERQVNQPNNSQIQVGAHNAFTATSTSGTSVINLARSSDSIDADVETNPPRSPLSHPYCPTCAFSFTSDDAATHHLQHTACGFLLRAGLCDLQPWRLAIRTLSFRIASSSLTNRGNPRIGKIIRVCKDGIPWFVMRSSPWMWSSAEIAAIEHNIPFHRCYRVAELPFVVFAPERPRVPQLAASCNQIWTVDDIVKLLELAKTETIVQGHTSRVTAVCATSDGLYVASASRDQTIGLWDIRSANQVRRFVGHTDEVTSLCSTPDSRFLVSGSIDRTVRVWDLVTGNESGRFEGHEMSVNAVCVTQDGYHIVSGSDDATVRIWNIATGHETHRLEGHGKKVTAVCVTPEDRYVISGSHDNTVLQWDLATSLHEHARDISGLLDRTWRIWDVTTGRAVRQLVGHTCPATTVCAAPDGRHIVMGFGDGLVRIVDMVTHCETHRLEGHTRPVTAVCVTKDGRYVASASDDKTARLWDFETGNVLSLDEQSHRIAAVCTTVDGRFVVYGSENSLRMWDIASHFQPHATGCERCTQRRMLEGKVVSSSTNLCDIAMGWEVRRLSSLARGCVTTVCATTDGRHIVSGSDDRSVSVWDIATGKETRVLEGHLSTVSTVCVTPDGRHVVSGSLDKSVVIWDVVTGGKVRQLEGHTARVTSVCVTPDGRLIVSGSDDTTVRFWDVSTGIEVRKLEHQDEERKCKYRVTAVCVTPNGHYVVSGADDNAVHVWTVATGSELSKLEGHANLITAVSVTPDGRHVVSASDDGTLHVWDLATDLGVRKLEGHTDRVTAVCVTADSRHVVSGSDDKTLRLWDVITGRELRKLEGHDNPVAGVCVTLNGLVVSGSDDKTVRVWDITTGREVRKLARDTFPMTAVSVMPDGRRVVSGSDDSTLRIWDVATGREVGKLEGHANRVTTVSVASDGVHVVSGSVDRTVRIWNVASGIEVQRLEGHTDLVAAVSIAPDGLRVVSASVDNTVRLWDAVAGRELHKLEGHEHQVGAVCVTPTADTSSRDRMTKP